jgi:hypothetical protein
MNDFWGGFFLTLKVLILVGLLVLVLFSDGYLFVWLTCNNHRILASLLAILHICLFGGIIGKKNLLADCNKSYPPD